MNAEEKHYSVEEIAALWGISRQSVRRLFEGRDGVLKISFPRLVKRQQKRAPRVLLRVPASILQRAHEERSRGFGAEVQRRRGGIE